MYSGISVFFFVVVLFWSWGWEASSRVALSSWSLPTPPFPWKMASYWSTGRLLWRVQTTVWARRSGSPARRWHLAGWRRKGRGTPPCRNGSLAVLPALWIWAPWCPGWSPAAQHHHLTTHCIRRFRKQKAQILLRLPVSWGCPAPRRWQTHSRCVLPVRPPSPAPSPPGTAPCRPTRWPAAGLSLWREDLFRPAYWSSIQQNTSVVWSTPTTRHRNTDAFESLAYVVGKWIYTQRKVHKVLVPKRLYRIITSNNWDLMEQSPQSRQRFTSSPVYSLPCNTVTFSPEWQWQATN